MTAPNCVPAARLAALLAFAACASPPADPSATAATEPVPELGQRVRIVFDGRGEIRELNSADLFFSLVVRAPDGTRRAMRHFLPATSNCAAMAAGLSRRIGRVFQFEYPQLVGDGLYEREFELPAGYQLDYSEGAFYAYRIVGETREMRVDDLDEVRIETIAKDGSRWVPLRTAKGGSIERAKDPVGWPPAGVQ